MPCYRTLALCLCFCLPYSESAAAEIYRWVDDQGRVHFGEKAPDDTRAEGMEETLQETGNFMEYPTPVDAPAASTSDATTDTAIDDKAQAPETALPAEGLHIDLQLVDYELPAETLEEMRSSIQAMYVAYQEWFGWPAQPAFPIKVKIFGSVRSFEAYQTAKGRKVRDRSYYSGLPDREIVMKGEHPESTYVTLMHEASHAILHMQQAQASKWVNEGLAEVFSTMEADENGQALLTPDREWAYTMKMMVDGGSLKKVDYYLTIPSAQWKKVSRHEERQYYMLAWSIMYFLTTTEDGRSTLNQVLATNLGSVLDSTLLANAFAAHYPGGIEQMDADWRQWLQKGE